MGNCTVHSVGVNGFWTSVSTSALITEVICIIPTILCTHRWGPKDAVFPVLSGLLFSRCFSGCYVKILKYYFPGIFHSRGRARKEASYYCKVNMPFPPNIKCLHSGKHTSGYNIVNGTPCIFLGLSFFIRCRFQQGRITLI